MNASELLGTYLMISGFASIITGIVYMSLGDPAGTALIAGSGFFLSGAKYAYTYSSAKQESRKGLEKELD
ncbi:MAG: hypothetical protein JW791_05155 [Nanoarchaeota archaeon]|nr:hypothetical protein [Nanoarchaeota archaeon]